MEKRAIFYLSLFVLVFILLISFSSAFWPFTKQSNSINAQVVNPSPNSAKCADSDNGIFPNITGNVTIKKSKFLGIGSNKYIVYQDKCINNASVLENYCDKNARKFTRIACANGCSAGACLGTTKLSQEKKANLECTKAASENYNCALDKKFKERTITYEGKKYTCTGDYPNCISHEKRSFSLQSANPTNAQNTETGADSTKQTFRCEIKEEGKQGTKGTGKKAYIYRILYDEEGNKKGEELYTTGQSYCIKTDMKAYEQDEEPCYKCGDDLTLDDSLSSQNTTDEKLKHFFWTKKFVQVGCDYENGVITYTSDPEDDTPFTVGKEGYEFKYLPAPTFCKYYKDTLGIYENEPEKDSTGQIFNRLQFKSSIEKPYPAYKVSITCTDEIGTGMETSSATLRDSEGTLVKNPLFKTCTNNKVYISGKCSVDSAGDPYPQYENTLIEDCTQKKLTCLPTPDARYSFYFALCSRFCTTDKECEDIKDSKGKPYACNINDKYYNSQQTKICGPQPSPAIQATTEGSLEL